MGADLYHMEKHVSQDRAVRYCTLKLELCRALGLDWDHDVTGPGGDKGASDQEVIDAVLRIINESRG